MYPICRSIGMGCGRQQSVRLVCGRVASIGLDPGFFGTHSLRRTKATLIYRRTGNLRAVQLLLGHTRIESTRDTSALRLTMLRPSPSRLTSELPGQSGFSSAHSFGQLSATSSEVYHATRQRLAGWRGKHHAPMVPSDPSFSTGRANWKTAPRGVLALAQSCPPCASMIERQIGSPIPIPAGLVV